MADAIYKLVKMQIALGLGQINVGGSDHTYFGGFISAIAEYPMNMLSFPLGFLIGDGFSTWGVIGKGGDYGHVETLHRFGLPFYYF